MRKRKPTKPKPVRFDFALVQLLAAIRRLEAESGGQFQVRIDWQPKRLAETVANSGSNE